MDLCRDSREVEGVVHYTYRNSHNSASSWGIAAARQCCTTRKGPCSDGQEYCETWEIILAEYEMSHVLRIQKLQSAKRWKLLEYVLETQK